ncbi:family 4 glycosyl hydrolase [Halanaerobium kushneri]|jgi:6-phospho-beta-glucosidase|uniref:6-phospho-beta-glucosidase n=1 Tax=Halanaerobium kushneri TaxID=56779 RepID=A0A1N6R217_9FIRM|nr:hypothetical protein [Halanaerobium kushneri]SIQ22901.1 6-phospho-beta-glucosidase [Halanaerobium kushneri]
MKVVIVGGGGVRTPQIIKTLYSNKKELSLEEITMLDIDQERLDNIKMINNELISGKDIKLNYTLDAEEAFIEADFILFTIRVGQIDDRIIDENIPLNYGVVGQETTGPGGFAMAMRTIPVMLEYLDLIMKVSPDAWILNLTNPSGLITQALTESGHEKVIGLCDGPTVLKEEIADAMDLNEDELFYEYFGLNHFGWIKRVVHNGIDITENVLNNNQALAETRVDPDFLRQIKMIPNEYLLFYYNNTEAVKNLKDSKMSRGEIIKALNTKLFNELRKINNDDSNKSPLQIYKNYNSARNDSYLQVETMGLQTDNIAEKLWGGINSTGSSDKMQTGYGNIALQVMQLLNSDQAELMLLNVVNNGAINCLDDQDVVEIPVYVDKNGLHPLNIADIPEHARGMLQAVKSYERLTIKAVKDKSYASALQALIIHPLIPDLKAARSILDDYIENHRYFPELK